jgi:hypothetical protein
MSLDVLLQILRALERLAAEVAFVRLQRNVDTDVRSNVVSLYCGGAAVAPLASQVQVVGTLATNVTLTDVILSKSVHDNTSVMWLFEGVKTRAT